MNLFASRLHQARVDNEMTQIMLAGYLGVSRQTINNYESGIREPGLNLLMELAHILDVSADWLLGNDSCSAFSGNPVPFTEGPIFAARLKDLRTKDKMPPEQLAAALGLPPGMYQKLEKGALVPDIMLVNKIARHFQVSIDWLLGKDDILPPHQLVPRKYLQEPYSNRLRERIILLRGLYQYTPADVAYFLRITTEEYLMFERGEYDPPVAIMLDLSRLYKLPVESLTTDNDFYVKEIKKRFL